MSETLLVPAGIAQVVWHLAVALVFYHRQRVKEGQRRVGLGGGRQVESGLGQVKAPLGQADAVESGRGRLGQHQRLGISQPDILAGKDQHAAKDKARVLAGMDHLGEPIHRRVGVRAAQGLDKGADGVIVIVPLLVIEDDPALDALLGDIKGDVNLSFRSCRWGGLDRQLQGVEHAAGVTIGDVHQVVQGILVYLDCQCADSRVRCRARVCWAMA